MPKKHNYYLSIPDIISNGCGSAVLQSLVSVLSAVEESECEKVVTHLLQNGLPGVAAWYSDPQNYQEDNESPANLPPLFHDSPTIRLLEVNHLIFSSLGVLTTLTNYH